MLAGELAHAVVVAGFGQDDADVRQRRFHQEGRDVAVGERGVERVEVVERHDPSGQRRIDLRSDRTRAGDDVSRRVEHGERLVHGAVVAPVHHADLRATGEVAGEAQHEAVGVGRRHRHLPVRESEPPGELAGDPRRVGGRQHGGDAALGLAGDRLGHLGECVPGHRAGVAEAEVDELVAVDVGEPGPVGLGDEQREVARPAGHPRHRNAGEQVVASLGGELRRPRM